MPRIPGRLGEERYVVVRGTFRYENVFAQASFQFCGHIDEYLIENTRRLGLVYFQTRNGRGEHVFRFYEEGVLKDEVKSSFRRSVFGYYIDWWLFWNRQLNRFRKGQPEVQTIFTHPLAAFGRSWRGNVRTCFWQWDYFPDGSFVSRLFNFVARHYASRCTVYCPLTDSIGQAVGLPNARSVMLGITAPVRFGDARSNRLLVVGQLRRGQGIEAVLDFIASHSDYSLSLLGAPAGDFGNEIRNRIAAANMTERICFPGRFVDEAELRSEAARCFASLALYDTSRNNLTHYADPGKVKSSIELGLPVVMTRISAIVPHVERFKAGEVIDSLDELPTAIEKIRSRPEVYFEGCRAFGEHFDYRRYYARFLPLRASENVGIDGVAGDIHGSGSVSDV